MEPVRTEASVGSARWVLSCATNEGGEMSGGSTRTTTFQATTPEVFAALQQAAERTGFQYLSGDRATGTYVFTAGMTVMSFGEKVTARIMQVASGTVQVTLS
jgi:hypothetical protein